MMVAEGMWEALVRTTRSVFGYKVESIIILGEIAGVSDRTIAEVGCWEDRENPEADADLIVAAVNQCKSINPENPQAAAEAIEDMY